MRRSPLFRRTGSLLILSIVLLALFLPPEVHAATYVGYGAANLGSSTCGTNCAPVGSNTQGIGETVAAPFASTLSSVGIFTGNGLPNQVVILTDGTSVGSTTYSCGSAGTCALINSGQSFTVVDVEGLSGLSTSSFNTISLANPPTITSGQQVSIVFMQTGGASGNILMAVGASGQTTTLDTCYNFGTTNPSGSYTTAACSPLAGIVGGTFTPSGQGGQTVTVTQCYGNCGSPAITLANTNSSHTINFNQTITIFYEFQSNLNGFVQNVTTSVAKSYTNIPVFITIGIYRISSCPSGQTPFSAACPAYLVSQLPAGANNPLPKGRVALGPLGGSVAVSNGQWVGIAVSATLSGLDLNDTNTNVNMFQTSEGKIPPVILAPTSLSSCACKIGLWAWIVGNVVSGGGATTPTTGCQSFATIDCWLPALVNGFCSNASAQCQTSSALFWIIIFSVMFEIIIGFSFSQLQIQGKIPFGEIFIFLVLMWTFILTGLSLLVLWVPVFLFMVGAIMFSKHTGRYF